MFCSVIKLAWMIPRQQNDPFLSWSRAHVTMRMFFISLEVVGVFQRSIASVSYFSCFAGLQLFRDGSLCSDRSAVHYLLNCKRQTHHVSIYLSFLSFLPCILAAERHLQENWILQLCSCLTRCACNWYRSSAAKFNDPLHINWQSNLWLKAWGHSPL